MPQPIHFQGKVRLIKYVFLSAGICVLVAIIISVIVKNYEFSTDEANLPTKDKKHKLNKEYTLSINNTVFEGFSDELMPYKILAQNISKNKNNNYVLKIVSGAYSLEEGEVSIRSENGLLDEVTRQVQLDGNVVLSFNGIELKTNQLQLDTKTKDAKSIVPVTIDFNNSCIEAKQLETKNSAKIIELKGDVKCNFNIKDFQ
ncbi:MAG: hypothetical protein Tsb006_5210 [Rickettsiaceae bacterium]